MTFKKIYQTLGVCFTLLLSFRQDISCVAMEEKTLASHFHDQNHHFERITSYLAVLNKVDTLLDQGVHPDDIMLITDWDNTINGPGAWSQKDYQGNYHFDTKRMLSEEEVDHRLRDPNTAEIIDNLIARNIKLLVATARPPLRDLEVINRVKDEHGIDLLDIRHPDNQEVIHYDKIRGMIDDIVNNTHSDELLERTRHKIQIMEERSGIKIKNADKHPEEIRIIETHRVVCHGGYIFTGYNKGPVLCEMLGYKDNDKNDHPRHLIMVDDCDRALKSFIPVLCFFTEKNTVFHVLHFPIK